MLEYIILAEIYWLTATVRWENEIYEKSKPGVGSKLQSEQQVVCSTGIKEMWVDSGRCKVFVKTSFHLGMFDE